MNPIGKEFMRLTRNEHLSLSAQRQGLPQPALELDYPLDAPLIRLPDVSGISTPPSEVRAALEERTSVRNYSDAPLTLEELSLLLWYTQGVKEVTPRPVTLRTVPSAGARHAFETYLLINRVEGLQPGLYRYIAIEHSLLALKLDAGLNEQITAACLGQKQVQTSAVTFLWAAVAERMTWRYSERSYRYLLLDAGHVCQNLYITAETIGCGVCAIAAYDDEAANAALDLDGDNIFVIYAASLGKRC